MVETVKLSDNFTVSVINEHINQHSSKFMNQIYFIYNFDQKIDNLKFIEFCKLKGHSFDLKKGDNFEQHAVITSFGKISDPSYQWAYILTSTPYFKGLMRNYQ